MNNIKLLLQIDEYREEIRQLKETLDWEYAWSLKIGKMSEATRFENERLKRELADAHRPARDDVPLPTWRQPKVVRDLAAMNDKFMSSDAGKNMAAMRAMADRARRDYGDALGW